MTKAKPADKSAGLILVMLGLDENRKPHAAKFPSGQRDLARKAAAAMAFELYEVALTPGNRPVIEKLPIGRLYSSGKGLVPPIREDRFYQLLGALGITHVLAAIAGIDYQGYPDDWAGIAEGNVVVAQCDEVDEGWFEAFVLKVENDMLTVKWRDYPKEAPFQRHRNAVALLKPQDLRAPIKD